MNFVLEQDGRLQSGDRILKIGDTNLEGMSSDDVAGVLRRSGNRVRLTIARGPLAFAPAAAVSLPESVQELQAAQVPPGLQDLDSSVSFILYCLISFGSVSGGSTELILSVCGIFGCPQVSIGKLSKHICFVGVQLKLAIFRMQH